MAALQDKLYGSSCFWHLLSRQHSDANFDPDRLRHCCPTVPRRTWARVKFTVRTTAILEGTPYCVVYACFREKGVAALETLLEQGQWW